VNDREAQKKRKEAKNMNYRTTKLYKEMTMYIACSIAEGFSGEEDSKEDILTAWQWLVDTGNCWKLQGWYGRTAVDLISQKAIAKPLHTRTDYYGNKVPGTAD
jgi:hypothetical protein